MNAGALTPERVLDAAEDVLRRFGPRKTTVVDVARALGVSHGAVYRHFASKADLQDASRGAGWRASPARSRGSPRRTGRRRRAFTASSFACRP